MDTLDQRREVIRHILTDLAAISRSKGGWKSEPVFDREHDSYMVLSQGWDGLRRFRFRLGTRAIAPARFQGSVESKML